MMGIEKIEKRIAELRAGVRSSRVREQKLSASRLGFMTRSDDLLYQFGQTLREKDERRDRSVRLF